MTTNVMVAYDDLMKLQKDSADKAAVISLLGQEFPDTTCQLIAIKAILGIKDEEDNTDEPAGDDTPSDTPATEPSGDDTTEGTDTEGAEDTTETTPGEGGTE